MPQSRRKSLAKKAGRCGKTCTDQPFCYNDYIHKQGKAGWMKIYTSYFGRLKKLESAGIEPVAICRGKPKRFNGRCVDKLAPTWPMMQMQLPKFWESYAKMLEPMELLEPFVEALQATKKHGDVKNAGAAVWLMTRAALRQFGEDDGRAYTPIMKLFGRAAIPTTTYEGVKSIIERKMKAGEISQPWEIFENMLGETYGARRRKAD